MHDPVVNRPGSENPLALPTALFREQQRMPESMLMGVAYEDFFRGDKNYHYKITDVSLPIFSNTRFEAGDEVKSIVGFEWDNTDPQRDGQRLLSKKNSLIPEIPKKDIHVLFEGEPKNDRGREGLAQAVFFETPSGAKVFSAGTMRWPWALSKPGYVDERFQRLNENLHKVILK